MVCTKIPENIGARENPRKPEQKGNEDLSAIRQPRGICPNECLV